MPEETPKPQEPTIPEESTAAEQSAPALEEKPAGFPAAPPLEPVKTSPPQPPAIEPLHEEGRFGKFMRNALRLLTLSLVMFAAGFLLAYFLIYQPTLKQLDAKTAELQTTSSQLETKTGDFTDLKGQYDQLVANATKIEARGSLALALRSLERAKQGIEDKNNPVVRTQLQLTRAYLDELLPYLEQNNQKDLAAELTDQMKSAETELVRDPQAIGPAVQTLMDGLDSLYESLSLAP